ncbi:hypothetical protein KC319_g15403 [Hortaea werneckii]|nr:hypothetical protein KC352_g31743 [Hortaea werneckii]KAI7542124.1 hypothetical protein KC317_g16681 [Hortaea werneckii]KAI7591221.1 hypothetical protein KC346_g16375 [Hortaea werneckii]KAI7635780.1 hypothetical protein KC319_g15403 [Hortaea werneckii]
MSGHIKSDMRPHLATSRVLNSDTLNHRFQIGANEAAMNHAVLDAHSQRHPFLNGEPEGPPQHPQNNENGAPGNGNPDDDHDGNAKDKYANDEGAEPEIPSDNDNDNSNPPNNLPNNNNNPPNPLPLNITPPSPFVRGRGHDPYGFFAKAEEAKRRRAAKKARVLARREVGRLRRWEEWRKGVWDPVVPPA